MTQVKSTQHVEPIPAKPKPSEVPTEQSGSDLAMRSLEAARLEAQISRDWDAYQKKPKRNFVVRAPRNTASHATPRIGGSRWKKVGNLNYPEEAKRQKIYGSLQLTVNIKADGSVERVDITRSSGHKELDEAAIRIVQLRRPMRPSPMTFARTPIFSASCAPGPLPAPTNWILLRLLPIRSLERHNEIMQNVNLTDHFLIAMPAMTDPYFAKSLTYVCEHSEQGRWAW